MPNRAYDNQITQFGPETTPGTAVAATKRLDSFSWEQGVSLLINMWRSQGRWFPSVSTAGKDMTDYSVTGVNDFNGIVYLLSMLFGAATITTHAGGTISKDWVWTVPLTGNLTPKTFTVEKGDANRAEKAAYAFLTALNMKANRKENPITAAAIAQNLQDPITLTGSLSSLAQVAIDPDNWDLFSDSTFGSIGTTAMGSGFDYEFDWSGAYDTFWNLKKSNASFDSHVNTAPKALQKVLLMADSLGMGYLANARANTTVYTRIKNTGPIIEAAIPYVLQIDAACQVSKVGKFTKGDGSVYALDYELMFVEDATFGGACKITVTNALTALT